MVTAVTFSLIVRLAVSPPPFEVITGASFALVTVIARLRVVLKLPSLAAMLML